MSNVDTPRLLAVGAVHIDDTARPVESLIAKASNPVCWTHSIGGVTANALRAARRESAVLNIDFIATIGDDAYAPRLSYALREQTISTRFVELASTATGRYTAILDEHGELFIGLAAVDNAERLTVDHITHHASALTPDGVMFDTNLHIDTIVGLEKYVRSRWQCPLIALAVSPAKVVRLLPVRQNIALFIGNRREAMALLNHAEYEITDSTNTETLARALVEIGFSNLVLTDGPRAVIVHEENHFNGAGDALAGSITAQWLRGMTLEDAVRTAGLPAASRILTGEILPQEI